MKVEINSDVLYILNNSDIEFRDENKKRFTNNGLVNFIRIYKFIPNGISLIRKRRKKKMATSTKATKAPAKKVLAKKAPAKAIVKKAPAKKAAKK